MINFNDPKGFYTLGMSCEYSGGGQLESNSLQRSSATHYFCQCSLLTPSASGFEILSVPSPPTQICTHVVTRCPLQQCTIYVACDRLLCLQYIIIITVAATIRYVDNDLYVRQTIYRILWFTVIDHDYFVSLYYKIHCSAYISYHISQRKKESTCTCVHICTLTP